MYSWFAEVVAGAWFFTVGACVGSFLNVVVYRVPRGITLLGNSSCPVCKHPIRPRDNLPIVGWLLLRGHCRDCRLRIAGRYPLVELLVAILFFSLAVADIALAAQTHPAQPAPRLLGFAWNLFEPQWALILLFTYHALLLSLLASLWLIVRDGQPVPLSLWLVFPLLALTVGGLARVLVWRLGPDAALPEWLAWCSAPLRQLPGAGAGFLAAALHGGGCSAVGASDASAGIRGRWDTLGAWIWAGALLGTRGVSSVLILSACLRLVHHLVLGHGRGAARDGRPTSGPGTIAGSLFFGVWLHVLTWSWLSRIPGWPAPFRPLWHAWAGLLLAAGLVAAARRRARSARPLAAESGRSDSDPLAGRR